MNSFRAIVFYHMGAIFCIMKGVHRLASASSYIFSGIHKITLQLPSRVAARKEQEPSIEIKRKPQSWVPLFDTAHGACLSIPTPPRKWILVVTPVLWKILNLFSGTWQSAGV